MTIYSYSQLEELWIQAGGPRRVAPLMAAIAMAESGGRSDAYNASGASGLWQILGAPTNWHGSTDWMNPRVNAKAAVAKYHSGGLTQWEAYTNGSYKKFLRGGVPPTRPGPGPIRTTSSDGGILGSLFNFFTDPADLLQRFGLIIFGGLLIVVGVMLLTGSKTLELTKATNASKPKEDAGTKETVRTTEGNTDLLRVGAERKETRTKEVHQT